MYTTTLTGIRVPAVLEVVPELLYAALTDHPADESVGAARVHSSPPFSLHVVEWWQETLQQSRWQHTECLSLGGEEALSYLFDKAWSRAS